MNKVSLHSHILVTLLSFYTIVLLNSSLGILTIQASLGYTPVNTTTSNFTTTTISPSTASNVSESEYISSALVAFVYAFHLFCLALILIALFFNNISLCARQIPPIMLFVLLCINLLFNIGGVIVLVLCSLETKHTIYTPKYSLILRSATIISGIAAVTCVVQIALSWFFPSRKTRQEKISEPESGKEKRVAVKIQKKEEETAKMEEHKKKKEEEKAATFPSKSKQERSKNNSNKDFKKELTKGSPTKLLEKSKIDRSGRKEQASSPLCEHNSRKTKRSRKNFHHSDAENQSKKDSEPKSRKSSDKRSDTKNAKEEKYRKKETKEEQSSPKEDKSQQNKASKKLNSKESRKDSRQGLKKKSRKE